MNVMTLSENIDTPRPPICDIRSACGLDVDENYNRSLFERPWDEFVVKRDEDGRYRSYTQCCNVLTPA